MLDTFRENARSWIIQVLIAAIAVVFVFSFGPASNGCGQSAGVPTWAADVNGETIPASAFESTYQSQLDFQRRMRGGSYSLDDARADDLRARTMKEVVSRELIAQAGIAQGLWVSDAEVAREVRNISLFQKNGAFDPETYKMYVTNYEGTTPRKFEERLRRDLLAQKSLELATSVITVSDDEIKNEFLKGEEAASIVYVRFSPAQFKTDVEVTDAEVEKTVASQSAELQKRYDENKWRWLQPKGVEVRRLFEPVAQDATTEQETAAREKVEAALKALEGGKSWEDVAQGFKNDTAAQGESGKVGWVELGRSPFGRTFEEESFKLEPGKRSGLVRDRFGFQIIEALDVRQAKERTFEDVKTELAREVVQETKAKELAEQAAEKALARLKAGESLKTQFPQAPEDAQATAKRGPQATSTDTFHPYGGFIPGIGSVPKLSAAVFALDAAHRTPEAPVVDGDASYVFQLTSRTRADLSKLDAERTQSIRQKLIGQKRAGFQEQWVETLRENARVQENPALLTYGTPVG